MHTPRLSAIAAVVLVAAAIVAACIPSEDVRGAETSLTYSVEAHAYNNTVRAGSVTDMLIPYILSARDPVNASRENVYLLGTPEFGQSGCINLTLARSTDGGQTFEPPRAVHPCLGLHSSPVAASDGTLFLTGHIPDGLDGETGVLRSIDAGSTWAVVNVWPWTGGTSSLAYDAGADDLYLVRSDYGYGSGTSLPVSVSHDHGQTWTDLPGPGFSQPVSFAQLVARDHRVVLAYVQTVQAGNQSAGDYLAAVSSADGGVTWSAPVALTSTGVAYCQYSAPFPAVSDTGVFAIAWYADTRDPSQVNCAFWDDGLNTTATFVALSHDGGLTWSSPQSVGGPPGYAKTGGNQAAVFDDRGRLYVVWKSMNATTWNVTLHVAVSDRSLQKFNTSTFTTRFEASGGNLTMTEGMSTGPSGRVYLEWESYNRTYQTDPSQGIFVRAVAGRARGSIRDNESAAKPGTKLELRDPATGAVRQSVLWSGSGIDLTGVPPDSYDVWVSTVGGMSRAGVLPVIVWGQTTFTVFGGAPVSGPAGPFPWEYLALAGVVSGAAAGAYAYTRLGHEDILQRKVRLLMYEYVRDHPGASYSEIRRAIGLQNGVAAYHLGVLVRQEFLHTESGRHRRWYYPNGDASLWRDVPLSAIQASIMETVRRTPGIGVRQLSRTMDRGASSVAENVRALEREGALRTERSRGRLRCYPIDSSAK